MPIIQGALAASSAGSKSTQPQMSEEQRIAEIRRVKQNITGTYWSAEEHPAASHVVASAADLAEEPSGSGTALENGRPEDTVEQEKPRSCCFGFISDEKAFRHTVTEFFEEPQSSSAAYWTSIGVLLCIVVSTITIILESIPGLNPEYNHEAYKVFFGIEVFCIAVFTIEYVTRFAVAQPKWLFVIQPMNAIDLLAILPFYIDIVFLLANIEAGGLDVLKLLRLARIFRVFKLSKYSAGIGVCAEAIVESKETLGLMVFMLSILVIVFASFEFFFEGGEYSKEDDVYYIDNTHRTQFVSIPAAMWWTMVTVMTVGYGDMVPYTVWGKFTAATAMMCAIVIMALPISVIGANFSRAWMEHKKSGAETIQDSGQRLERSFEDLLESLYEQNAMMEDIISEGCLQLETLHQDLKKAKREYAKLKPDIRGNSKPPPLDPHGGQNQEMNELIDSIATQERKLQFCLQKLLMTQNSRFEEDSKATLLQGKELENYVLRHQEISGNVVGLEQVVFSRSR